MIASGSVKFIMGAALVLGLSACQSPGERAVGGALIGGGSGALIGGAFGGRRGALAGAGIGAVGGAIAGAATTPQDQPFYREREVYREPVYRERVYREPAPVYVERRPQCPYGSYQDEYGNVYCR